MFTIKKLFHTVTYTTLLLISVPVYGQSNNTPITQSQINQPNGVAGLNDTGKVTSPIKTKQDISTTTHIDIGNFSSRPRATFFRNYDDIASSPHTIHFGGLERHSDAYLNVIGLEMGAGDASGAILSVQDSDASFYENRNGAGMTDGVLEFTKTNNNAPRLKAGSEIKNTDNINRTVTITKDSFSVSPAFSTEQMKLIIGSGRIRVFSNWKNGNIISNATKKGGHGLDKPNLYFGYISPDQGITTKNSSDEKSTTTFIVYANPVDYQKGWRTTYNPKYHSYDLQRNTIKNAPGQNIDDTIDNINDKRSTIPNFIWSYSTPAVFIGMTDKKFIHNDMVQFIPGDNNHKNRIDSISRDMVGVEYDLLAMQDHDYQYAIHGIMVGANGNGHKLTDDSEDMYLGGNINHHLIIGEVCGNYAIETNSFIVRGSCTTRNANSGYIIGQFKGQSYYGEKIAINIANLVKNHPEKAWGNNVPAIIATIQGDDKDPLKASVGLGGIKWKQDNDIGSISLCGGSFAKNCTLTVGSNGEIKIGMKGILASDQTGKNYVQWYPTTKGDWLIGTSIPNGGNLRGVNGFYGTNATISNSIKTNNLITNILIAQKGIWLNSNLTVGHGKSVIFLTENGKEGVHEFSDNTGNLIIKGNTKGAGGIATESYKLADLPKTPTTDHIMLWCSDCKIHGIAGAPVWWHARISKWTDSQNNILTNQ